ncbi:hypothetical protein ACIHDR_46845 [Nocardia sp. NPDC052278]|uniref:hypothetical protein n=1 Tax=unclassified Nocardia TaxID=2637762 RepID=UPI003674529E
MSKRSWPAQLDRFRAAPQESYRHVVDEYVSLALNRNTPLFGRAGSLTDRLAADDATPVLQLADRHMETIQWALYRVRRVYFERATAWRSIDIIRRGTRTDTRTLLDDLSTHLRVVSTTDRAHTRLWLEEHDPADAYPHTANRHRPRQTKERVRNPLGRTRSRQDTRTRPRRHRLPRHYSHPHPAHRTHPRLTAQAEA